MAEKYALKKDFDRLMRRFEKLVKDSNNINSLIANESKRWSNDLSRPIDRMDKSLAGLDRQISKLEQKAFGKASGASEAKRLERDLMKYVDKALAKFDKSSRR